MNMAMSPIEDTFKKMERIVNTQHVVNSLHGEGYNRIVFVPGTNIVEFFWSKRKFGEDGPMNGHWPVCWEAFQKEGLRGCGSAHMHSGGRYEPGVWVSNRKGKLKLTNEEPKSVRGHHAILVQRDL